jgi:hypothetical protein
MRCPRCNHTLPFVGWRFQMKNNVVGQITKLSQGKATIKKLVGGILCGGTIVWPENRIEELIWVEPKEKIS